jgi:hypothetical protein
LQRVIAFHVGIRPHQSRLEFPELHSGLDAVAGMAVLSQRQFPAFSDSDTKQEQLSRSKSFEGWSMGQVGVRHFSFSITCSKLELNCCVVTVA